MTMPSKASFHETSVTDASSLERGSGTALWRQIEQSVAQAIEGGTWTVGERLPTEMELAARFGVNRHTLRRAMTALEQRGVVRVEQGRGTFVQERVIDYPVGKRTRFNANVTRQKREPASRLLQSGERSATPEIARELGLRPGAPVLFMERLGVVDGRPVSVGHHYFPARRFPTFLESYHRENSITGTLQREGVPDYTRKSTRVIARLPDRHEAELLLQPRNRAVLVTESVNVDANGKPVEYGVSVFAADRVQITFES